jgi:hypothetical protein
MTYTGPTDDIIVQEGTFAFDFTASGAVYGGQAVYVNKSPLGISVPSLGADRPQPGSVGVVAYDQSDGKPVAVYGIGNICRVIVSGTCIAGDILYCTTNGKVTKPSNLDCTTVANPSGVYYIALEDGVADDDIKVFII